MNASIHTLTPPAPAEASADDLLVYSQDDHVEVRVEEPEYVRVDIELADPLKLVAACTMPAHSHHLKRQFLKQGRVQGIDPAFHPARFLGAIAVSTNDMVNAHLTIDGNHSQHLAIVPKDEKGLDTDCINEVLSTLCIELPPGVVLHDAPSPDLRIIWTDETGATETQRIPGEFLHRAAA